MSVAALRRALDRVEHPVAIAQAHLRLAGRRPPFTPTGIALKRGQAYTLLADGVIHWSPRHPQLYAGPSFHLWGRVHPGGRLVNVSGHTGSFIADADGELELGIYLGMWLDEYGRLETPAEAYAKLDGELEVVVLTWPGSAQAGLAELAASIDLPLLATALRQAANPLPLPAGWDYLLETGRAEIYRDCSRAGHPRICLDARDEQGIIRHPVDFPLAPDTELSWRWHLIEHPSRRAEDSVYTHDYISVAAEFDNGRDLTWIWSSSLDTGHYFDCPIKAWRARETHYVVRSGLDCAGRWFEERRRVRDDVAVAMGEPPSRIVAIWLITVASFQHGVARAEFEALRLCDGVRELQVL